MPSSSSELVESTGTNASNSERRLSYKQQHKISSKSRQILHSMGSLSDDVSMDGDENQAENTARAPTGGKCPVPPNSTKAGSGSNDKSSFKQPPPTQLNELNMTTDTLTAPNVMATSTALMRQHRRRLLASSQIAASILTPTTAVEENGANNRAWDGFVRKGTQFKSFLDEALQHVATGYAVTNLQGTKRRRVDATDKSSDANTATKKTVQKHNQEREEAVAGVAKEKTKEVFLLQQKLEEAQSQVATLTASNNTLREESTAAALRFERTIEALKISAANAAAARSDAEQAEASADGLTTQLEALKMVVEQTKQAAQVLHEEQEDIAEQARISQTKLLQVQADLARSQKETKQLHEKAEEWESKTKTLQGDVTTLKRQLADQTEQSRKLNKALEERDAVDKARKKRSQEIEKELRETQALLVEASSKAAKEEETLQALSGSIEELQEENKRLHEQLTQQQKTSQEEKDRLQESLREAEGDARALRIEASLRSDQEKGDEEDDKHSALKLANAADKLEESFRISTNMNLTPKNGGHAVPPAETCSICMKRAVGLLKSCQCGRPNCDKRAHIACANKIAVAPSVSHPGTPAAPLPVILCSGVMADIINKRRTPAS